MQNLSVLAKVGFIGLHYQLSPANEHLQAGFSLVKPLYLTLYLAHKVLGSLLGNLALHC